jgi:hypothetical protein
MASGRITPPADRADLVDEAPADYGLDASGVLQSMRDLER